MRCKACDNELTDNELVDNPMTGELEDLCSNCRGIAFESLADIEDSTTDDLAILVNAVKDSLVVDDNN